MGRTPNRYRPRAPPAEYDAIRRHCDWAGPEGWLRKFRFEMRRMLIPDDIAQARGKVTAKLDADEKAGLIELEVWLETERVGVTTPNWATTRLPRRS